MITLHHNWPKTTQPPSTLFSIKPSHSIKYGLSQPTHLGGKRPRLNQRRYSSSDFLLHPSRHQKGLCAKFHAYVHLSELPSSSSTPKTSKKGHFLNVLQHETGFCLVHDTDTGLTFTKLQISTQLVLTQKLVSRIVRNVDFCILPINHCYSTITHFMEKSDVCRPRSS